MIDAPDRPAFVLRPARATELSVAQAIDDDACMLYAEAGLPFPLPDDHPFSVYEGGVWTDAIRGGRLWFACTPDGEPFGFAAFGHVDQRPFLHQLSTARRAMGRGIGGALLRHVLDWAAAAGELTLTTYDHVPWNAAWYERVGFRPRPAAECGPELRDVIERERAHLPDPDHRVALTWRSPTEVADERS